MSTILLGFAAIAKLCKDMTISVPISARNCKFSIDVPTTVVDTTNATVVPRRWSWPELSVFSPVWFRHYSRVFGSRLIGQHGAKQCEEWKYG
jgi:hypothetical protein